MDNVDPRIVDYIGKNLTEYKPEPLYGIFFNGKRVRSTTYKYTWTSEANAKKALYYMISGLRFDEQDCIPGTYYSQFNLTPDIAYQIDVNILLESGILEIRKVGNT